MRPATGISLPHPVRVRLIRPKPVLSRVVLSSTRAATLAASNYYPGSGLTCRKGGSYPPAAAPTLPHRCVVPPGQPLNEDTKLAMRLLCSARIERPATPINGADGGRSAPPSS